MTGLSAAKALEIQFLAADDDRENRANELAVSIRDCAQTGEEFFDALKKDLFGSGWDGSRVGARRASEQVERNGVGGLTENSRSERSESGEAAFDRNGACVGHGIGRAGEQICQPDL